MALLALLAGLAIPALILPAASANQATATGGAVVEIVQTSPLTVAGRGFKPKERVRYGQRSAEGRRRRQARQIRARLPGGEHL
jgi:hypothetical protein